jgi:hypothetical protein
MKHTPWLAKDMKSYTLLLLWSAPTWDNAAYVCTKSVMM